MCHFDNKILFFLNYEKKYRGKTSWSGFMKTINMKKFNKVLILPLLLLVLANCAGTNVTTYSSASIMLDDFIEQNGGKGAVNDETLHYPLDIQTLSCSEMQANRLRISNLINNLSERVVENSNRSTSYSTYGLTKHDPLIGTSFIGVSSVGLNPEVSEFRKLKLVLEELNTTSILKCTPPEVMRTP